jgi:hypothetical protein
MVSHCWRNRGSFAWRDWSTNSCLYACCKNYNICIVTHIGVRDPLTGYGLVNSFIDHLYTLTPHRTTLYRSLTRTDYSPQFITVSTNRFLATDLTQRSFFSIQGHAVARWLTPHTWTHSAMSSDYFAELNSQLTAHSELRNSTTDSQGQSQSYVTTGGQSAILFWNKVPVWVLKPEFYFCQTVGRLFDVGCSLWREDESVFCQSHSHQ